MYEKAKKRIVDKVREIIWHQMLRIVQVIFSQSFQTLSHVRLFVTSWIVASQASLSIINSRNLLKLMSFELMMTSNNIILCHRLLLPPSIFPSIRVFTNE